MMVLRNAKKLKDIEAFKSVYLKWDEPRYTRLENQRLRKKKYDISRQFPGDSIELKKGILRHNNVQCDKFDLMNQIF